MDEMMINTIVFVLLAAMIGAGFAYLIAHVRVTRLETEGKQLSDENVRLRKETDLQRQAIESAREQYATLISRRDVLQAQVDSMFRQFDEMKFFAEKQKQEIRQQMENQIAALKDERDRLLAESKSQYERQLETLSQQHDKEMSQQAHLIREQFKTASEDLLKQRAEELAAINNDQMKTILSPLNDHLRQMREAVERSGREHTNSMERLDASIKANLQQAREVGERADKLAQALTADNKMQGNFGELRLRTLLENMGLEEGVQFEEQTMIKDDTGGIVHEEEGRRMIPDVILHVPDKRDVIIDSKVSLKAFEEYFLAESEEEKADALSRHLRSIKNHVKELSHKNYSNYMTGGRQKPDFVIMYVYNESALQIALANDSQLYKQAYDDGVIISGSQNMFMMLRVLEMTWRQVRQAENQEEIMKAADNLVNRVQMFYERFILVDEQLKRTQEAFDKLRTTTAPTGSGIITAANRLLSYGAKENPKRTRRLPRDTSSGSQ